MENVEEILKEALLSTPKNVRALLFSDNLTDTLKKVALNHAVSPENAEKLREEAVFVLLGLTEQGELVQNIQIRLGIPPLRAREIVEDIKKEIFAPIQASLDAVNEQPTTNNLQPTTNDKQTIQDTRYTLHDTRYTTPEPSLSFEGRARVKSEADVINQQPTINNPQPTTNNRQQTTGNEKLTTGSKQAIHDTRYTIHDTLPDDVQTAISSVAITTQIQAIGEKNQLHVDTVGALMDETQRVMKGETHPKDYIRNLTKRLSISDTKAKEVAVDINEQIFRPVRESLKKIHKIGDQQPTINNPQPTTINLQQTTDETKPAEKYPPLTAKSYSLKATENLPTREEALRELESPPKIGEKQPTTDNQQLTTPHAPDELLEKKMAGPFALPQKEAAPQTSDNRKGEIKKREDYDLDPYREPVE